MRLFCGATYFNHYFVGSTIKNIQYNVDTDKRQSSLKKSQSSVLTCDNQTILTDSKCTWRKTVKFLNLLTLSKLVL